MLLLLQENHFANLSIFTATPYGGFLKWGYPQNIHFSGIVPYKPSSYWGTPVDGEPPYQYVINRQFSAIVIPN